MANPPRMLCRLPKASATVRPRVVPGTRGGHHGRSYSAPKPSPGAAVHTCGTAGSSHSHYYHETATPSLRIHLPLPPSLSVSLFFPPPHCAVLDPPYCLPVPQAHEAARSSIVTPLPFLILTLRRFWQHPRLPAAAQQPLQWQHPPSDCPAPHWPG